MVLFDSNGYYGQVQHLLLSLFPKQVISVLFLLVIFSIPHGRQGTWLWFTVKSRAKYSSVGVFLGSYYLFVSGSSD